MDGIFDPRVVQQECPRLGRLRRLDNRQNRLAVDSVMNKLWRISRVRGPQGFDPLSHSRCIPLSHRRNRRVGVTNGRRTRDKRIRADGWGGERWETHHVADG